MLIGGFYIFMANANEIEKGSNDLRKMLFNLNPNEIGLSKEEFKHPVWGIVIPQFFMPSTNVGKKAWDKFLKKLCDCLKLPIQEESS